MIGIYRLRNESGQRLQAQGDVAKSHEANSTLVFLTFDGCWLGNGKRHIAMVRTVRGRIVENGHESICGCIGPAGNDGQVDFSIAMGIRISCVGLWTLFRLQSTFCKREKYFARNRGKAYSHRLEIHFSNGFRLSHPTHFLSAYSKSLCCLPSRTSHCVTMY